MQLPSLGTFAFPASRHSRHFSDQCDLVAMDRRRHQEHAAGISPTSSPSACETPAIQLEPGVFVGDPSSYSGFVCFKPCFRVVCMCVCVCVGGRAGGAGLGWAGLGWAGGRAGGWVGGWVGVCARMRMCANMSVYVSFLCCWLAVSFRALWLSACLTRRDCLALQELRQVHWKDR